MKKLLLMLCLLPISGFANTIVYCPEIIACTGTDINSCTAQGQYSGFWGIPRLPFSTVPGIYIFTDAWINYKKMRAETNFCSYKSVNKPNSNYIQLPNLEKHVYDEYAILGNKWGIFPDPTRNTSRCKSNNVYDCPYQTD